MRLIDGRFLWRLSEVGVLPIPKFDCDIVFKPIVTWGTPILGTLLFEWVDHGNLIFAVQQSWDTLQFMILLKGEHVKMMGRQLILGNSTPFS